MTKRFVPLAVLGGLLAVLVPAGHAQPDKTDPKPARPTAARPARTLYQLRHADPAAVAAVVEKHVGDLGVVTATDQGLLVTSAGHGDEIGKLIEQLDRPVRQVVVVVTLAEVMAKDQLAELKGSPDQIRGRLEELANAGRATLKRVTLTAAEGQPVTTTSGGDRAFVTGRAVAAGGGFGGKGGQPQPFEQRSVSYRSLGTTVKMTARVLPTGAVAVDLGVKDTGARPQAEEGASEVNMVDLTTRVTVPPGAAVLAQAIEEKEKAARTTVIVVTARVVDGQ